MTRMLTVNTFGGMIPINIGSFTMSEAMVYVGIRFSCRDEFYVVLV